MGTIFTFRKFRVCLWLATGVLFLFAAVSIPVRAQDIQWARQFGTARGDNAYGVAVGTTSVYVVGNVGDAALPGQTSAGLSDAFLRKYDLDGTVQWTRQFGSPHSVIAYSDQANGVAVDATGVYVAGMTDGALPGQTSAGGKDAFVRKYDANGTELWTRQFGTAGGDSVQGITADGTDFYVVGYTGGSLPGQTSAGGQDAFVRKYDANGTELWTRQFGTAGSDVADGMATDATGLYLGGKTDGTLTGQIKAGFEDAFVRKYDANGNVLWTRQFGSSLDDKAYGVAADPTGVYIVGYTRASLPGQTSAGAGFTDAFVRKYDANGNAVWTRQFGTTGGDYAYGVVVDATGVYVVGFAFGILGQTWAGAQDAFVRKYDTNGTQQWTVQFGSTGSDSASGVALDATGLYVSGGTDGTLPGQTSAGESDIFIAKIKNLSSSAYYLSHLALGGGWQTTITYVNYSPQTVTCDTTFYSDSGGPLSVSFGGAAASSRTDTLGPGTSIHQESTADLNAPEVRGWAKAVCSGPIKASLLFRFYQQGVAVGEAGVNAMMVPATKFVTFSDQTTGVAYANPSTQPAAITFTALSSTGTKLASKSLTLLAGAHDAANMGPFLGLSNFKGSIQITSTVPIVSLSLNAEAFPAFSSLPPGELEGSTTSYFPHLALGGGWQTTITYVNYSSNNIATCTTTFFSDSGGPLLVPFGGVAASSRTDTLGPGQSIHQESTADLNAPEVSGWARAQCGGLIKASLLFRFYQQGKPTGEAGVNAMVSPTTKFVTFSDQSTGVAYANPSTQSAEITFTAISSTGTKLASKTLPLLPGEHGAANVGSFLGISSFTGSIQIVSTVPIISLSLNAEAFPVVSSLPPGDLDGSTPLALSGQATGGDSQ